jgi:ligand-binding sensor domain-containing protein
MRRAGREVSVMAALALAAPLLGRSAVAAQAGLGAWEADERVVITDFQRVTALARSSDHLFAATDGGLVVLDDAFERWELPITREDGYPDAQVLALGWDRRDGTLWLSTRDGRLMQLDMFSRRWLDEFSLPGTVTRIVAPADDPSHLFLRRGDGWFALDPFTRDVVPASTADVQQAVQRDFDLRARGELLSDVRWEAHSALLGRRGSARYDVTDVMPATGAGGQFWVATYGGFLERYDSLSGAVEPVAYGMVGIGAGAVLASGESVWLAPAHASDRYGVAVADRELEEWRTWTGQSFGFDDWEAPDAPIRAWLAAGDDTWAGGDRGLHRFDGEGWHRESPGTRTDVAPITSLAAGPPGLDGVWVGTRRGLFRVRTAGALPDAAMLSAARVRALAVHDADLWIGTDAGLVRLRGDPAAGDDVAVQMERAAAFPESAGGPPGRVGALAADNGRLYAGIERDVWVLAAGTGWTRAAPLGVLAARVTALAAHEGVVWIGSDEGLVAWDTRDDFVTPFTFAGGDLPVGPRGERGVLGLSIETEGAVWAATPAGAVRLDPDW